jgi:hypothetical protein
MIEIRSLGCARDLRVASACRFNRASRLPPLSNTKHKLFVHKHLAAAAVFSRDFLEKREKLLDRPKQMF